MTSRDLPAIARAAAPTRRVLRVAADPNNLPFTNQKLQGFENRIADLIARELDAELQYSWRAQRRGFFREAFKGDECDVVLGAPPVSSGPSRPIPTTDRPTSSSRGRIAA